MAQLTVQIVSSDQAFKADVVRMLRTGSIPVSVFDEKVAREGTAGDVIIVDTRSGGASALAAIEKLRLSAPAAGIFAVAAAAEPDAIISAMRAGANEFFAWPAPEDAFHAAIQRTAVRLESTVGVRSSATTLVFFGAKGGAGTTTVAVNCGVELARLSRKSTLIVDLKPGLCEVSLFLGVRPRYSVLDAIDNMHRLDREFLRELVVKHKSGLEILAGSDQFDRPGSSDGGAIEELFRLIARQYDYILVDAGSHVNSCTVAALYTADQLFLISNPYVPSIRNAQRLLDKIRQLGACSDRVRVLLNRMAEPYPIPPKQIEGALGRPIHHMFSSDYKTVSTALNSGVPLALSGASDIATQFDSFTRRILDQNAEVAAAPGGSKRGVLGLEKIASLW